MHLDGSSKRYVRICQNGYIRLILSTWRWPQIWRHVACVEKGVSIASYGVFRCRPTLGWPLLVIMRSCIFCVR